MRELEWTKIFLNAAPPSLYIFHHSHTGAHNVSLSMQKNEAPYNITVDTDASNAHGSHLMRRLFAGTA